MKAKKVYYGFLIGNLGKLSAHYKEYAEAVKEALQIEFPDAEVEIAYQKGMGTVPIHLLARVEYDTDSIDANQEDEDLNAIDHTGLVVLEKQEFVCKAIINL